jgi:ABC-type nickel/cobalt efflux system permease component RcnA
LAGNRSDEFTQLITLQNLTLPTILFALLISFIWGAMHAMTPGHGKTIVGAYLVGSRGTAKQALYLGLTTTITHTLGVFIFGLITLFAAHFIVPEKLFPWMSFLSGLFVVGIGGNILISRFKSSGMRMPLSAVKADLVPSTRLPWVIHQLSGRAPADNDANQHRYIFAASHDHEHFHSLEHIHDHGGPTHSHLPPKAGGEPVTWRNLLALGVSGGILPCPSALVVLLASIALNRIGFGMILVLAFSIGLAGALTLFGLLFIYAGRFFERLPLQGKLVRIIPVFSALFIIVIGLYITTRALFDIGMPL